MHISMLENGVDSLQKGFDAYLKYIKLVNGKSTPELEDYYVLKEAILSTHHGVEILLKYILNQQSEFLIVEKFDEEYKKAFREKLQHGYKSIFTTQRADKLHTITYDEALSRVEYLTCVHIDSRLKDKLERLNKLRNALTHAGVFIDDNRINSIFDGLLIELDVLFITAIGQDYKSNFGYSEIKANYDEYMKYLTDNKKDIMKNVLEALSKSIEKTRQYSGQDEILYIEDINTAKVFLKELQKNLIFGMDLFNCWCSGEARLNIKDEKYVSIWANDVNAEAVIKFKSMIIYIPRIKSNQSPIIILEADDDIVESEYNSFVYEEDGVRCLDGLCIYDMENPRVTYNRDEINEFECRCDYDESFPIPKHYGITRFLSRKIIGCFNIQCLPYWDFNKLLHYASDKTGAELAKLMNESE